MSGVQRRHTVLTAVTAVLALGAAACSGETTEGKPANIDVDEVSGFEITDFESGFKDDAPTPEVDVDGDSDSREDKLAKATIADMDEYWGEVLPRDFDMEYQPVNRLVSYDAEEGGPTTECGPLNEPNAFYCPPDDTVAWDRGYLLPLMTDKYGAMSPVTVLAHEYGHAVQHRLGEKANITPNSPTILAELQADCFTGSYMRWLVEDNSKHLEVSTVGGLNASLSSLYFVRDEPGSTATQQGAHGTAFDRTWAFQEGFEDGATRCAEYTEQEIKKRTTQQEFAEGDDDEGDLPIEEQHLELVKESLDYSFDTDNGPEITTDGGSCNGQEGTPPASYCTDASEVSVDLDKLAEIGQPIDIEAERRGQEDTGGQGDFAAWASVASRYVLAVQQSNGQPIDDKLTGLRTACLVGSWASTANRDREDQSGPVIRLSSGDVDEAILEMLEDESLIASDVAGEPVPSGFLRIEAFRTGYNDGPDTCGATYTSEAEGDGGDGDQGDQPGGDDQDGDGDQGGQPGGGDQGDDGDQGDQPGGGDQGDGGDQGGQPDVPGGSELPDDGN